MLPVTIVFRLQVLVGTIKDLDDQGNLEAWLGLVLSFSLTKFHKVFCYLFFLYGKEGMENKTSSREKGKTGFLGSTLILYA